MIYASWGTQYILILYYILLVLCKNKQARIQAQRKQNTIV